MIMVYRDTGEYTLHEEYHLRRLDLNFRFSCQLVKNHGLGCDKMITNLYGEGALQAVQLKMQKCLKRSGMVPKSKE